MASNIYNFSNYHTVTLYMYDFNFSNVKVIPLTALGFAPQENIKVKVVESQGLDVARAGERFITDVELNSDVQRFCDAIDPVRFKQIDLVKKSTAEQEPMSRVDYAQERYWALTSRLRGFHVTFLYNTAIVVHPLLTRPINRPKIEALLGAFCGWDKESLDEEHEEAEDSLMDSDDFDQSNRSDSDIIMPEFSSSSADSLLPENYEYIHYPDEAAERNDSPASSDYRNRFYKQCSKDPSVIALNELCSDSNMGSLLVIEYNEGRDSIVRHEMRRVRDSVIVEFFDDDDAKCCTVFVISSMHASAWDPKLHSDEGAYDSGINLYGHDEQTHGIVLMGEQNDNITFNYATALYQGIIVPDLANEDVLAHN